MTRKKFEDRSDEEIVVAIREGFATTDTEVIQTLREAKDFSGSCACCFLLVKNKIFVANLGDSRIVMAQRKPNNKLGATALSSEHKPKNEKQRLVESGGWVSRDGRINGILSCSRAFGDREFKFRQDALLLDANFGSNSPRKPRKRSFLGTSPSDNPEPPKPTQASDKEELGLVLSEPEISVHEATCDEIFLVIASDGFWEVYSSKRCVELVVTFIREGSTLDQTAKRLCEKAVKGGTKDDVTVVLVVLDRKRLDELLGYGGGNKKNPAGDE